MCGIYGIWHGDGRPVDTAALRRATDRQRHRGPDDEGYLLVDTRRRTAHPYGGADSDARLGIAPLPEAQAHAADLAFGFRRLAILDTSPAGHQPLGSADGRYWIVFNGEIYNYIELRATLQARGYSFRSATDTEVALAAYREWGESCLQYFNGMWALAIWDAAERSLFLARDRLGIKPLHYTFDGATFAFASEIKALVGAQALPFRPDSQAIWRYLASGFLPNTQRGETFFGGVRALPPGCWMRVANGTIALRRFWRIDEPDVGTTPRPGDPQEIVAHYRDLFLDAVRLQLRSDVPVGTCLSGGIDSSSIVCAIDRLLADGRAGAAQLGPQQQTFSAVYAEERRYNERKYVERVLRATGAAGNFTMPSAEQLLRDAGQLIWHQDEPFQSTSIFAQWCVMRSVRERGVTVLLDGQGADEMLAGYRPFQVFFGDLLRSAGPARMLAEALAAQARTGAPMAKPAARALLYLLPHATARRLRRLIDRNRVDERGINPDLSAAAQRETYEDWLPWEENATLGRHLRTALVETSLPHLLRYEDRSAMAFGVEARVPFLDHRLVELAFGAAAPWRIHRGWTKWVHRAALEPLAPGAIIWRSDKVGFETPEIEWARAVVVGMPELFGSGAYAGAYLDLPEVRRQSAQIPESRDAARRVWRWINLELWLRAWED
jgi:asparagine synthase (glutamine-hydrolysing)